MTSRRSQEKKLILQSNELNERSQETNQNMIHLRERKRQKEHNNTAAKERKKAIVILNRNEARKLIEIWYTLTEREEEKIKDAHRPDTRRYVRESHI